METNRLRVPHHCPSDIVLARAETGQHSGFTHSHRPSLQHAAQACGPASVTHNQNVIKGEQQKGKGIASPGAPLHKQKEKEGPASTTLVS